MTGRDGGTREHPGPGSIEAGEAPRLVAGAGGEDAARATDERVASALAVRRALAARLM